MQDLGLLTNSENSQVFAINDSGAVVGTYTVSGEGHAFIWTAQTGMQDLNLQISPASTAYLDSQLGIPGISGTSGDLPIVLVGAQAINNKGQIIAAAMDAVLPCADLSGACPMGECAPMPKYFLVLTPQ
jgi:probable HAF family extracellular repeat protein